jgi:hypothetical protein
MACERQFRLPSRPRPKTFREELVRLESFAGLRDPSRE